MNGIAVGADGNPVETGASCLTDLTSCNFRTIKYNGSTGAIMWNVVFDSGNDQGSESDEGWRVSVGSDGHPIIVGASCFDASNCSLRTIKYDGLSGNILWNITVGTSDHKNIGVGAGIGGDGNPVVAGHSCVPDFSSCDGLTIKLDGASGATMWTLTFDGSAVDLSTGDSLGLDGNPVVGGSSCIADFTLCDFRVIKYLVQQDTPEGSNVAVALNGGSSVPDGGTVTYSAVTAAGSTTFTASTNGPAPPAGFAFIGTPPTYYEIATTATVTAPIEVCLNYSTRSFAPPESDLRLFHYEGGTWVDVTTSLDTDTNVICGSTSSLSAFAIGQPAAVMASLGPANVWIGLKNSDDVGIKFDLRAEIYRNGTQLVGSGQIASVAGGSSGFNNAHLDTIDLTPFGQVGFPSGSTLSIKLLVRNACTGSRKNSGAARLWYDDGAANSRFDATIGVASTYYLRSGGVLSIIPGPGPKKTTDVAAGAKCSPFKPFGTWTTTIQ